MLDLLALTALRNSMPTRWNIDLYFVVVIVAAMFDCSLQMFHLLHHDGEGGLNLLVDGFHCAKVLQEQYPESYKTLSEISVPSHSAGDAATHIVPSPRHNPILNHDQVTKDLVQIRFNSDDRSTL